MFETILSPDKDPMGTAITDYYNTGKASKLRVFSSMFDEDEIPVGHLFREFKDMSKLEQKALKLAQGKILDVGAGSGCHALALKTMNKDVAAIDISHLSVEVMRRRGIENVMLGNFFGLGKQQQYDTILLLMNGSGIIGTLNNLPIFFHKLTEVLSPDGFVLMDSSDLRYLFENEDGSYDIDLNAEYYGEVDYYMKYKNITGDTFDWLYLDFETLSYYAEQSGFKTELVLEGSHYEYLCKIYR